MNRKGQNWSLEVMLALSTFLIIFVLVGIFMYYVPTDKTAELQKSTDQVISTLENDVLLSDGVVLPDGIATLNNYTCDDLKDLFAITGDVCINFEDTDGNIVMIDNKTGIGCPGINFSNGKVCGER